MSFKLEKNFVDRRIDIGTLRPALLDRLGVDLTTVSESI